MKSAYTKICYFLDFNEWQTARYIESLGKNAYDGQCDIVFEWFDFPDFNLIETDAYGEWNITYQFDYIPSKKEILKLELFIMNKEREIVELLKEFK